MVKFLLSCQDKTQNLDGYICEKFFSTEKLWDGLLVFRK